MIKRNVITGLLLLICLAQIAMAPGASQRAGTVTVLARGTAGLRIEGRSDSLSLEAQGGDLVFQVPLASIETGIGLRDRHLRECLQADRFPVALLRVPRAGLAQPDDVAAADARARGELTLHGVSRPIEVRYRAERDGAITRIRGTAQLDVREFDVKLPSYLGVTVAPLVEIQVALSMEGL